MPQSEKAQRRKNTVIPDTVEKIQEPGTIENEFHVFEPLTLDEIENTPDLDFLTDNFIVRNTVNVFYAPAKTGKTYLCLHYAVCLAMNIPFIGMENHLQRNVGYLNLDMRRFGFVDRFKQVIKGFAPNNTQKYTNDVLNRLKIIDAETIRTANGHTPNFFKNDFLSDLRNFILLNDIEFLFVDTLSRVREESKENDTDDMSLTLQHADEFFSDMNCGCLFIHHAGKNGELRGSSAIIDNSEFVFGLKRVDGNNKHLKLFSNTPRYTDVFEYDVYPVIEQSTNEETGACKAISYSVTTIDPDSDKSHITQFMRTLKEPMSARYIAREAGHGYNNNLQLIYAMYTQGILDRKPKGTGYVYWLKNSETAKHP